MRKIKAGLAWTSQAALRFQIPSQASLHGILKTHRPLAPRAALLLRALREIKNCQELASRKSTGLRPACWDGGVFENASASSLARDLQKGRTIRAANNPRDFSASPSVLIRAIRGKKCFIPN